MKTAALILNSRIESGLSSLNSLVQAFNSERDHVRRSLDECARKDRELEERFFELTRLVNHLACQEGKDDEIQ